MLQLMDHVFLLRIYNLRSTHVKKAITTDLNSAIADLSKARTAVQDTLDAGVKETPKLFELTNSLLPSPNQEMQHQKLRNQNQKMTNQDVDKLEDVCAKSAAAIESCERIMEPICGKKKRSEPAASK